MRIGLFGQFGCGNSGNDGSLQAMASLLADTRPDAELVCICPNPQQVESDLGLPAIACFRDGERGRTFEFFNRLALRLPGRFLDFFHPIRRMRGIDMLLVPGTGFLDDFQETPFGWPLMIFRWSLAARLTGARLAFASIGAGPIHHPVSRMFMTAAARLCHYRSYRDQPSRDYMAAQGVGMGKDEVYPDLAFALKAPKDRKHVARESLSVGVGVMTYSGWTRGGRDSTAIYERYLDKIVAFITWLREQGHDVRLLTGDVQDQKALWHILGRLEEAEGDETGSALSAKPARTLPELMREIAQTDIVVATRFHNVVCAMAMGRPIISLGYAQKNEALLTDAGLQDFSQHVEHFDLDLLKDQFLRAAGNRMGTARRLAEVRTNYVLRLSAQAAAIAQMLPHAEPALPKRDAASPGMPA